MDIFYQKNIWRFLKNALLKSKLYFKKIKDSGVVYTLKNITKMVPIMNWFQIQMFITSQEMFW